MSATGNPSRASLPLRYNRVRAWHLVGVEALSAAARTVAGSRPLNACECVFLGLDLVVVVMGLLTAAESGPQCGRYLNWHRAARLDNRPREMLEVMTPSEICLRPSAGV